MVNSGDTRCDVLVPEWSFRITHIQRPEEPQGQVGTGVGVTLVEVEPEHELVKGAGIDDWSRGTEADVEELAVEGTELEEKELEAEVDEPLLLAVQ